jgi:hypothetical protein
MNVGVIDETVESEKSVTLTKAVKKNLDDVLMSYDQREAAIKLYAERAESHAKDIIAKANCDKEICILQATEILEKAKCDRDAKCEKMLEDIRVWEEEKISIARTYNFENNKIMLDIGGQKFTTTLTTLTRFPDTMIGAMFSGRHDLKIDESGAFFIDRDGRHFCHILNFLRSPEGHVLNLESNVKEELKNEALFYGLSERMFPKSFSPALQRLLSNDSFRNCQRCSRNMVYESEH